MRSFPELWTEVRRARLRPEHAVALNTPEVFNTSQAAIITKEREENRQAMKMELVSHLGLTATYSLSAHHYWGVRERTQTLLKHSSKGTRIQSKLSFNVSEILNI